MKNTAASVGGGVTLKLVLSRPVTAAKAVQLARAYEKAVGSASKGAANTFFALQRQFTSGVLREFSAAKSFPTPRAEPDEANR